MSKSNLESFKCQSDILVLFEVNVVEKEVKYWEFKHVHQEL